MCGLPKTMVCEAGKGPGRTGSGNENTWGPPSTPPCRAQLGISGPAVTPDSFQ